MVVESVLLKSTFPQLLQQLGRPVDRRRLTGGQLRTTDRAMAASSVRTSLSEAESRSTVEEDRLLMKRCIERQR